MNNKGMTLVELIVTFALLMAVVIGLYNLILSVKNQMEEREVAKEVNAYSSITNNHIHYNLLKAEPKYLFIKSSSNSKWELVTTSHTYDDNENISLENGSYNYNTKTFNENYCHMIYPCLIYVNENTKNLGVVALLDREYAQSTNSPDFLKTKDYGVLYGEKSVDGSTSTIIYDPLPDTLDLMPLSFTIDPTGSDKTYITYYSDERILEINYPLFITDNPKNYGFRISYPLV